jgi:glycine cleavage system aminomethyltransferase T
MSDLEISGPDAIDLYSDFAINDFSSFEPGQAKQLVTCSHDGYLIGDAILFHLGDEFLSVGPTAAHNWLVYNAETGGYDVSVELRDRPVTTGESPKYFRYQIQGPDALAVMKDVTEQPLADVAFFNFAEMSIEGRPFQALRHGMAGEAGYEIFGPYEYGETIRDAIMEAGEAYDIRRVGARAYMSITIESAWVPLPVQAIYTGEEMQDYRDWLDARRATLSIGGSYDSDDIEDYYIRPTEVGYERFIDFDHDFVGRDALEEAVENPSREKVTLVWDDQDAIDVYGSLFQDGETNKYMEMPTPRWSACHYDEVFDGDEHAGVSVWTSYTYNEREMLSLGIIDVDRSDPGTELTLVWGEADESSNPEVERHARSEVDVTVAPAPYTQDRR